MDEIIRYLNKKGKLFWVPAKGIYPQRNCSFMKNRHHIKVMNADEGVERPGGLYTEADAQIGTRAWNRQASLSANL